MARSAEETGAKGPATLRLTRRGAARWRAGHPWIFRDDIEDPGLPNGELVRIVGPRDEPLGGAFYGSVSKIAVRRLTGPGSILDESLFETRIETAILWRRRIAPGVEALRLVSSDADGLPGLIVDRYGPHLVIQSLIAGIERRLEPLVARLVDSLSPISVLARNDSSVRRLEGLPIEVRVLRGEVPDRVEIREGSVRMRVDLHGGQKSGAFLDQRENRRAAAAWLGGRVLDAFCYDGGFALQAAGTCEHVTAVDSSEPALARARENAVLNGLANIDFVRANVFDYLSQADRDRRRFDGIVLDPPAFAKSRKDLDPAVRAYKEINLRALRCLQKGGILVTCSCSYNLREEEFVEILASAAADAGRRCLVIEKRGQAIDHPVLLGLPESHYLKCVILKVD